MAQALATCRRDAGRADALAGGIDSTREGKHERGGLKRGRRHVTPMSSMNWSHVASLTRMNKHHQIRPSYAVDRHDLLRRAASVASSVVGKSGLYRSKGLRELRADRSNGDDDHDRYQRGDEPIFDRRCTCLVLNERPQDTNSSPRKDGLLHNASSSHLHTLSNFLNTFRTHHFHNGPSRVYEHFTLIDINHVQTRMRRGAASRDFLCQGCDCCGNRCCQ
jgi:hypothetical protein